MRRGPAAVLAVVFLMAVGRGLAAASGDPGERFHEAGALVRDGDLVKGIAAYRDLAASGVESSSLYWNWAEAAASRGETGEALWAALRAREVEPGDGRLAREIQRFRESANLDPAEIAPEPLGVVARASRRLHLGLLALILAGASVAARVLARLLPGSRLLGPAAYASLALAALVAVPPLAGSLARPTGVVVRRGAPLFDSASPSAATMGSLRLGEVVPIVERSRGYLRVEDSSGARGWARQDDVWPLDQPPAAR